MKGHRTIIHSACGALLVATTALAGPRKPPASGQPMRAPAPVRSHQRLRRYLVGTGILAHNSSAQHKANRGARFHAHSTVAQAEGSQLTEAIEGSSLATLRLSLLRAMNRQPELAGVTFRPGRIEPDGKGSEASLHLLWRWRPDGSLEVDLERLAQLDTLDRNDVIDVMAAKGPSPLVDRSELKWLDESDELIPYDAHRAAQRHALAPPQPEMADVTEAVHRYRSAKDHIETIRLSLREDGLDVLHEAPLERIGNIDAQGLSRSDRQILHKNVQVADLRSRWIAEHEQALDTAVDSYVNQAAPGRSLTAKRRAFRDHVSTLVRVVTLQSPLPSVSQFQQALRALDERALTQLPEQLREQVIVLRRIAPEQRNSIIAIESLIKSS